MSPRRVADSQPPEPPLAGDAQVLVNRAPVLTLWGAVVARHLGFDRDESLTLGRVLAGLNAYAKGRALGVFQPTPEALRRERARAAPGARWTVELMHRAIPVVREPGGLRALSKDHPVDPASVQRYLEGKFGAAMGAVETAFDALAGSLPAEELALRAYELYEAFRPQVPAGTRGWGAPGVLDLGRVYALAR